MKHWSMFTVSLNLLPLLPEPGENNSFYSNHCIKQLKVRSHGAAAAAIFLPQQPESFHTVQLQLSYIFK